MWSQGTAAVILAAWGLVFGSASARAEAAHAVLLGHPWLIESMDGVPVGIPGAITFSLADDAPSDGCSETDLPNVPADECTSLEAAGPIGCGDLYAIVLTAGGRLFSPSTSTGYTQCSQREVIIDIGEAFSEARTFRVSNDVLELIDSDGVVRLSFRAGPVDYVPPVVERDMEPEVNYLYRACAALDWSNRSLDTEDDIAFTCTCIGTSLDYFGVPYEQRGVIIDFYEGEITEMAVEAASPGAMLALRETESYCVRANGGS